MTELVSAESVGPLGVAGSAVSDVLKLSGRDGQLLVAGGQEPGFFGRLSGKAGVKCGFQGVVASPVWVSPESP